MTTPSAPVVSPVQSPHPNLPMGGDAPYPMPGGPQQPYQIQQPYPMPPLPYGAAPGGPQPYPPPGRQSYPPPITAPPPYGQPGYPMPPAQQQQPLPQQGPMTNWMPVPQGIPHCPPGLEYLTQIDQLLVHQKVEWIEVFIGFETNNKYSIKNRLGQKVYYAKEDTDCWTRNCCGPSRPFDMEILDNAGKEVIHLYRPLRCSSCWCPCCLQRLEVCAPPGQVVGYVTQEWSIFYPEFRVENAAGDCVLCIDGPFCTWSICGDVEFQVMSRDRTVQVGKITKEWSGLLKEAFTDADNFGITFPMDLDVKIKAVLLGACFLIDFMFFEKSRNIEQDRPGML